jgi:hypothetical protein
VTGLLVHLDVVILELVLTLYSTVGDLDLYTPHGIASDVVDFLLAKGYTKHVKPDQGEQDQVLQFEEDDYFPPLTRLNSITKLVWGDCRIDVLESDGDSVITPITWFHSTMVMNYLTDKSFVMLYPAFTLKRVSVLQSGRPQQDDRWWHRYRARKYEILLAENLPDAQDQGAVCIHRKRSTDDRHSLIVPYEEENDFNVVGNEEVGMELDEGSGKEPYKWEFCTTSGLHNYCTPDVCKLKLYLKHDPPTVVEFAARRAYCDMSKYFIICI